MTAWPPRILLEDELRSIDSSLATAPDDVELRFNRAATLTRLGRPVEARTAFLELLALAPTDFRALNGLGALLMETGYETAARTAYAEAVRQHPENPVGHINLANALAKKDAIEAARRHFEIALRLAPENADVHQGLAYLFTRLGDEQAAAVHRRKVCQTRPVLTLPYRGASSPVRVLLLASAAGGAVPIKRHLDDRVFLTSVLFVDFYDRALSLPAHDLVFNAVGDADLCADSLAAAVEVLRRSTAPVINPPERVMGTGRVDNARRLARIQGVVTPKMALLPRALLESSAAASTLSAAGFDFPLLLRSPGFHTGRFFVQVENTASLDDAVRGMPGTEFTVMQYLDARGDGGKIRKYRVMMIDGEIYPLHVAVSHQWKIHYFSAEMADDPTNRAEDAAFLQNMTQVLGPRAMASLEAIRETLGLDYAGADFSIGPTGDVLLFEANATMVVNPVEADPKWDYRRPAVQRVLDAIRRLLTKHAPRQPASAAAA
ncbi:MAG TPA: hypothetical protein VHC22_19590 [Pirellulales bacterium]|nr:hypothetical protein [Pirellulales bacterium]